MRSRPFIYRAWVPILVVLLVFALTSCLWVKANAVRSDVMHRLDIVAVGELASRFSHHLLLHSEWPERGLITDESQYHFLQSNEYTDYRFDLYRLPSKQVVSLRLESDGQIRIQTSDAEGDLGT